MNKEKGLKALPLKPRSFCRPTTMIGFCLWVSLAFLPLNHVMASGFSQSFESETAHADIIGMRGVTTADGKEYGCLLIKGAFLLLVPDKKDFKQTQVVKFDSVIEYKVKKFVGPAQDGNGKIYLAEGSYAFLISDPTKGKMEIIGSTDGKMVSYVKSLAVGPPGVKEGFRFKGSPKK